MALSAGRRRPLNPDDSVDLHVVAGSWSSRSPLPREEVTLRHWVVDEPATVPMAPVVDDLPVSEPWLSPTTLSVAIAPWAH